VIYHVVFTRPVVHDGLCFVCDRPYDDGRCRLVRVDLAPPDVVRDRGVHAVATVDCDGFATGDVRPCPCAAREELA
jgi:hypothetical protein